MEKFIFRIEENILNKDLFKNIYISSYQPIQDEKGNKFLLNKLSIDDKKLFLETGYLKVKDINREHNKIYLELTPEYQEIFDFLDECCLDLLQNFINTEEELKTWDIEWDSQEIEYVTDIHDSSIKVTINQNTTISMNKNNLSIDDINIGDSVAVVLGLDFVSLLIDTMEARTKLFCYVIDVHKHITYVKEEREKIDDWDFVAKKKTEQIFIKTETSAIDNIDVKTDYPRELDNDYSNKKDEELSNDDNNDINVKDDEEIKEDNKKVTFDDKQIIKPKRKYQRKQVIKIDTNEKVNKNTSKNIVVENVKKTVNRRKTKNN
jgi:hypothetical protein